MKIWLTLRPVRLSAGSTVGGRISLIGSKAQVAGMCCCGELNSPLPRRGRRRVTLEINSSASRWEPRAARRRRRRRRTAPSQQTHVLVLLLRRNLLYQLWKTFSKYALLKQNVSWEATISKSLAQPNFAFATVSTNSSYLLLSPVCLACFRHIPGRFSRYTERIINMRLAVRVLCHPGDAARPGPVWSGLVRRYNSSISPSSTVL